MAATPPCRATVLTKAEVLTKADASNTFGVAARPPPRLPTLATLFAIVLSPPRTTHASKRNSTTDWSVSDRRIGSLSALCSPRRNNNDYSQVAFLILRKVIFERD